MDFEKYTERAKGFVQSAQNLALREGHQQFSPEHILKVLLDDDQGLAAGDPTPRLGRRQRAEERRDRLAHARAVEPHQPPLGPRQPRPARRPGRAVRRIDCRVLPTPFSAVLSQIYSLLS